jgi:integrase
LDTSKILELIKDRPNKTQINILCSILAFIGAPIPEYTSKIFTLSEEYKAQIDKNVKTESQKENWKSHDDIVKIYDTYYKNNSFLLKKQIDKVTDTEIQLIQNLFILALTCGKYFDVVRSSEWTEFKIDDVDEDEDNYKLENELVFNKFKTVKAFGRKTILLSKDINTLLDRFIMIQQNKGNKYLFVDKHKNKLTAITFNQRMNKLYGGHISTSLIRHIYTTDKTNNDVKEGKFNVAELSQRANNMGHSTATHMTYYKNDA